MSDAATAPTAPNPMPAGAPTTPPPAAPPGNASLSPGGAPPPAPAAPPEWRAALPADLRDAPSIAKFQDPGALAKSYVELEGLIGRKGVVPPKPEDPPSVHAAFRQALGVPEAPEGYALAAPEGVPEGVWKPEAAQAFATEAHKLGLTPAQAQGLAAWFAASQAEATQSQAAAREAAEVELRKTWGAAYGQRLEAANRVIAQFGEPGIAEELEASGWGNNPRLAAMLARLGEAMAEDAPAGMGTSRSRGVLAPEEAKAELSRLTAPGSPYWDKRHPEHRRAVERALDLRRMQMAG